jgi:hypothetical protein
MQMIERNPRLVKSEDREAGTIQRRAALINRNRWVTNVLERDTQIDGTSAYALQLTQASPGLWTRTP